MKHSTLIIVCLTLMLSMFTGIYAQALSGEKTIGAGGTYTTFTAAVNALNTNGVGSGGVTFNVLAGSVFSENIPIITATGTVDNPIIFQKSGEGNNPRIVPSGTTSSIDAGINLRGGDYFTFDGIDINSSASAAVEVGFLIRNVSATNGAQYNTIKNTNITMRRDATVSGYLSAGIYQTSQTYFSGYTPTNASGANSNNKYYNLNIQNACSGVVIYGYNTSASGWALGDIGCEIGTTDDTIRNTINNIGNSNQSYGGGYGVYTLNTENFKLFNTDVTNVTSLGQVWGVYIRDPIGMNQVSHNKVMGVYNSSSSSLVVSTGILIDNNQQMSFNVKVYNNAVSDIRGYNTTSYGAISDIKLVGMQLGSASNWGHYCEVYNNTVSIGQGVSEKYSSTAVIIGAQCNYLYNNIFANFANTPVTPSLHFAIVGYNFVVAQYGADANVYYSKPDNNLNGYEGARMGRLPNANGTWDIYDIAGWRNQIVNNNDDNSVQTNPHFANANSDLRSSSNYIIDLPGYTYPAYVTDDFNHTPRPAGSFAGAYPCTPYNDSSTITAPVTPIPAGGVSSEANSAVEAVDVFSFLVSDIGTDGQDTKITTIKILNANPAGGADWSKVILGARLKVNGSYIDVGTPSIKVSYILFTLPASLIISSESSATLTLAIYLTSANEVVDRQKLQFKISRTNYLWFTESWGSRITDDLGADVVSSLMHVEVTATEYKFTSLPASTVNMLQPFSLAVEATDKWLHKDLDFVANVTVSLNTGSGTLTGFGHVLTWPCTNGAVNFSMYYNRAETITLKISGSLPDLISNSITLIGYSEITTFTGASGTGTLTYPVLHDTGYGRSVALYNSSEIGGSTLIESISWSLASVSYINTPIKIYMKTSFSTLSGASSWQSLISGATLVYTGNFQQFSTGWKNIMLNTNFNYLTTNGYLMVMVESDYGSTGYSPTYTFNCHNTTSSIWHAGGKGSGTFPNPFIPTNTILRPNIRIHYATAAGYSSSTTVQNTASIAPGAVNQDIIQVAVTSAGSLNPVSLSSLTFNTTGTTNVANIVNAKVFYTGTSAVFATTTQFGATVTNVGAKGSFSVTGTQTLPLGTSYYWLAYDVAASSAVGNAFDAQCTTVRVASVDYTPTITNPGGSRIVTGKKISSVNVYTTDPYTTSVASGASNLNMLYMRVYVESASDASARATLPLNSISFTSKNTNDADVSGVKLYRSSSNNNTDVSNQLGTSQLFVNGTAVLNNLAYDLPLGYTYLFMKYDVSGSAAPGNILDAKILANAIVVGTDTYPATVQDPGGQYTIVNYNYGGGYAAQGGYYFANTLAVEAPTKPTFNWIDISATGTNAYLDMSNDNGFAPNNDTGYDIGFSFPYFGASYTKFWIMADGGIGFIKPILPYGQFSQPQAAALVYYSDFHPASPNYPKTILYKKVGTELVVTFLKCQPATGATADTYITAQIVLFPNGKIKMQYLEKGSASTGTDATVYIANQTGTATYNYRYSNQLGPIFGDNPIAVAFGQNAYMLSDTPAANDLPIPASGTPTITFPNTGATVAFTTSTTATNLTAIRVNTNPGGTPPAGVLGIANRHWTINSTATSGLGQYNLTLNLMGTPNVTDVSVIKLLKREHVTAAWSDMGTPVSYDNVLKTATWSINNGFSDFGIGLDEDNPLPVTLSSFTAVLTAELLVTIAWVAESETNHAGYNLLRATEADLSQAIQLNSAVIADGNHQGSQVNYVFTDNEVICNETYHYWLESVSLDNHSEYYGPLSVTLGNGTTDPETPVIPLTTKLLDAFPNPFNPNTNLRYSVTESGNVRLDIYNLKGQRIISFNKHHDQAGHYQIAWDGRDEAGNLVATGVYFYRMTCGKYSASKKMVMAK
ncbi:MAG: BNR-repeat neuraminidase N-terminal domain-containing protein [Candidatus Cloacimonetes bacterium]|nr:BNR-repeat neuraminidase N-terminal domain-containing protein [Candidatus Cloacimonadota bacterium]